jgi:hypothetical protein
MWTSRTNTLHFSFMDALHLDPDEESRRLARLLGQLLKLARSKRLQAEPPEGRPALPEPWRVTARPRVADLQVN